MAPRNRIQRGDGLAHGNNWLPFGFTGAPTNAHYAPPGTGASSANIREVLIPIDCRVVGITLKSRVAPAGVVVDTFTVMRNGVATTALATITGAATTGSFSNANGPVFNAGDRLSVQVTVGLGSTINDVQILVIFQS